jgi:hypothetical protein
VGNAPGTQSQIDILQRSLKFSIMCCLLPKDKSLRWIKVHAHLDLIRVQWAIQMLGSNGRIWPRAIDLIFPPVYWNQASHGHDLMSQRCVPEAWVMTMVVFWPALRSSGSSIRGTLARPDHSPWSKRAAGGPELNTTTFVKTGRSTARYGQFTSLLEESYATLLPAPGKNFTSSPVCRWSLRVP